MESRRVAEYSRWHAGEDMVNVVVSRLCVYEGCGTGPNFGVESSRMPLFRKRHDEKGMHGECQEKALCSLRLPCVDCRALVWRVVACIPRVARGEGQG